MSTDERNLFSEVQLSQLATMMPHLISKAKIQTHDFSLPENQTPEVQAIGKATEQESSLKDETQKGLLRLAEFLKKQKPSAPPTEQVVETKIIPFKKISHQNPSFRSSVYVSKRGFETYKWVKNASDASEFYAVQLNKYL